MKTLTLKDLARTDTLDHADMAAVRGGHDLGKQYCPPWSSTPSYFPPGSSDSSIHATQDLSQLQSVTNATANGSAYLGGVDVTNKTKQFGQNNIHVG
jgi:hypothetical protein